ncbi:MAG: DUF2059 domain-containing protein [Myxococcales bacterium]|nr:DUF2059 domain-containing protein [Myxococcales bacterium]
MRTTAAVGKLVALLLFAGFSAACQVAPPAACLETPVATPPPETPENHAQAVRELFRLMQMDRVIESTIDTMLAAQLKTNPSLIPFAETMRQFLYEHLSWASLEEEYVEIYMRAFTQREVEDMVAFYSTPTGQKAVEKMPELVQLGAAIGQRRMLEHIGELQEQLRSKAEEQQRAPDERGEKVE